MMDAINWDLWTSIGMLGQICFAARLLVQWMVSEKHKKSVIPIPFWYCSMGGGLILLTYAVHQKDPVFILGQAFGLIVYIRNLMLISREKQMQKEKA